MKKTAALLASLLLLACNRDAAEQPERLLSEQQMADIMYDLSILQAMQSVNPTVLADNGVNVRKYIYNKYAIDSTVFAQNYAYYAASLDQFEILQRQVAERLKAEKEKEMAAQAADKPAQDKLTGAARVRDSLRQGAAGKEAHR